MKFVWAFCKIQTDVEQSEIHQTCSADSADIQYEI
jgi:hypothetical protein